jgi:hypothetical protein
MQDAGKRYDFVISFPSVWDSSEAIEPAVGALDDPTPGLFRSIQVYYRDRLNAPDLIFGKLRKTLVSTLDGVPAGDRLNRAFIDVIDHGDVALAFAKSLSVPI